MYCHADQFPLQMERTFRQTERYSLNKLCYVVSTQILMILLNCSRQIELQHMKVWRLKSLTISATMLSCLTAYVNMLRIVAYWNLWWIRLVLSQFCFAFHPFDNSMIWLIYFFRTKAVWQCGQLCRFHENKRGKSLWSQRLSTRILLFRCIWFLLVLL